MVIMNIKISDDCRSCPCMRCSVCVPMNSAKVEKYVNEHTKPEWCPIIKEIKDESDNK